MKPSVGRIVHYTSHRGDILAALITRVRPRETVLSPAEENAYDVNLRIFAGSIDDGEGDITARGSVFTTDAAGSEGARGRWTWPARVPT